VIIESAFFGGLFFMVIGSEQKSISQETEKERK